MFGLIFTAEATEYEGMLDTLPVTASFMITALCVHIPRNPRGSLCGQALISYVQGMMCKICSARAHTRKQMSIFS